mgnify:CR=1 FL=1
MCLFGNENKYQECNFCGEGISEDLPYLFQIIGLGKHDNKYICIDCILDKLLK